MKQYRLLRDNKETGPHTADDLIKLGFKKYDLIWAEGKSAAWRYPGELEEFKLHAPVIEEQPYDRFYKKADPVVTINTEVSTNTAVSEKGTLTTTVTEKKEKPRIRIKADSHRIDTTYTTVTVPVQPKEKELVKETVQQPVTVQEVKPTVNSTVTTPEWKEIWLDWEQEKKAVSSLPEEKEDPVLETKFSLSLDEIKERYAETVLKPKRSALQLNNNHITAIVLIVAILGVGVWMGVKWSGDKTVASNPGKEVAETPVVNTSALQDEPTGNNVIDASAVNNETTADNTAAGKKAVVTPAASKPAVLKKETVTALKKPVQGKPAVTTPTSVTKPNDTKAKITTKNDINYAVNVNKTDYKNKPLPQQTTTSPAPSAEANDIAKILPKTAKEPKIKDYIAVDSYSPSTSSVAGSKYKIQNISNIPVDLVMIDLQYYDASGHYLKGETVYARNLSSGETVTIQAPENPAATKINYKVSMVSSETKNLYLIAD